VFVPLSLVYALPKAAVLLCGIVWLFTLRRHARRATGLALVALFGMMLMLWYQVAFQPMVIRYILNNQTDWDAITVINIHGTLVSAIHTVLLGLLIAAVAIDRRPPSPPDDE
jgi:hypothetical protein